MKIGLVSAVVLMSLIGPGDGGLTRGYLPPPPPQAAPAACRSVTVEEEQEIEMEECQTVDKQECSSGKVNQSSLIIYPNLVKR